MENLDWSEDDMDKIIYLMSSDNKFLAKCRRKRVEPELFSSEVRKKFVRFIYDYFDKYNKAPVDDLVDMLADNLVSLKEDDQFMYSEYLVKLSEIGLLDISQEFLLNRLDFFVKKRIAKNTLNKLIKLEDRFGVNPDKPLEVMREALEEVASIVGEKKAESILEDEHIIKRDIATRFNIPYLDAYFGGGIKFGSYGLIMGFTSSGKSWAIDHLIKCAARIGVSCLYLPIEMANTTAKLRLRMCLAGMSEDEVFSQYGSTREIVKRSMQRNSNIFILGEEEKGMSVVDIPSVLEDIKDTYGIEPKLILIDSLDDMRPPPGRYSSELEANSALHTWIKNFAKDTETAVINTVQSRRDETIWWLSAQNIGGNIKKAQRATWAISINSQEGEVKAGYFRLYLFKHTDGAVGAKVWVKRNFNIGQFVIDAEEYRHNEYIEMIKQATRIQYKFSGRTVKEFYENQEEEKVKVRK
jgi:hypothetical protein